MEFYGKSVATWSKELGRPYESVKREFLRGHCVWPRRGITGQSKDPAYGCWENMIQRCTNPSAAKYDLYGGRGIRVCSQWQHNFAQFLADVGPRPDGGSLDLIDGDGHYEPGNVRWASSRTQARNSRAYKGGHIYKHGRKYRAEFGGVRLGAFATEADARAACLLHAAATREEW